MIFPASVKNFHLISRRFTQISELNEIIITQFILNQLWAASYTNVIIHKKFSEIRNSIDIVVPRKILMMREIIRTPNSCRRKIITNSR